MSARCLSRQLQRDDGSQRLTSILRRFLRSDRYENVQQILIRVAK
jgi:hypothetical protein